MLKTLRKWRKRMWLWQILLGDLIALLKAGILGYWRRWMRKRLQKTAGKHINKLRG